MPNYYNAKRGNEHWSKSIPGDTEYSFGEIKREIVEKSSKDLIIDDNSVYEIDQDCYERVRKNRMNARQDWNRK